VVLDGSVGVGGIPECVLQGLPHLGQLVDLVVLVQRVRLVVLLDLALLVVTQDFVSDFVRILLPLVVLQLEHELLGALQVLLELGV